MRSQGVLGSSAPRRRRACARYRRSGAAGLLGLVGAFQGVSIPGLDEAFGVKIPTFGVVFQALKSTTGVDVLSTPHLLLTTDNEEAEITVGKNVPFASSMMGGWATSRTWRAQRVAHRRPRRLRRARRGQAAFGLHSASRRRPQAEADAPRDQHRSGPDGAEAEIGGSAGSSDDQLAHHDAAKIETVVVAGDSQTIVIGGLMGDQRFRLGDEDPVAR